jgi:hypothetical protein
MITNLWTWGGTYFGHRDGDDLWTHSGRHVGRFHGDELYGRMVAISVRSRAAS